MLARVLEATKAAGFDTPTPSPHVIERSPTPLQMQQGSEGYRIPPLPQPAASHTQAGSSPQCTVIPPFAGSAGGGNNSSGTFPPNSTGSSQGPQVAASQPLLRPSSLTTMPSPHGAPHAPLAHCLISAENGSIFNSNSPTGSSGTPPLPCNPVNQRLSPSVNSSTIASGILIGSASGTQGQGSSGSGTSGVFVPSLAAATISTGTQNNCSGTSTTGAGSGVIGVLGSSGPGLSPSAPQGAQTGSGSGLVAPTSGSSSNSGNSSSFSGSSADKDKASAFGKLFHYMNEMKKELEVAQKQRREGQLETQRLREKCQQMEDRLAMEHSKSAGLEDRLERAKVTQRTLRSQVTLHPSDL
jgi:hypothetical protein